MNLNYVSILTIFSYAGIAVFITLLFYVGGIRLVGTTPGVTAHIILSLFAMSLLALASLQAVLLGWQNYLLKQHRAISIVRILPPLQTMEEFLFLLLWGAMLFLSLSLCSGFFFQKALFTATLLPKTILALLAWSLLILLLVGRYYFGWRGPTAIRWTLTGTLLAFLSYFGTKAL